MSIRTIPEILSSVSTSSPMYKKGKLEFEAGYSITQVPVEHNNGSLTSEKERWSWLAGWWDALSDQTRSAYEISQKLRGL